MPTALIAEDEPLLAQALRKALAQAWPELTIVASVGDGLAAVVQTLHHKPDIVFLDIRMPGQSGIEAATELTDQWGPQADGAQFPALVFVTAYEQYAVQAFEAHAVDYLVKPLQTARLCKTVERLRQLLEQRQEIGPSIGAPRQAPAIDRVVNQLRQLLRSPPSGTPVIGYLSVLQASVGNVIHMVPMEAVLLLEAADKYIRVLTSEREYLIRTPLRDLLPQLDPQHFWQVHRSVVVRAAAIDTVTRDASGKLWLRLHERAERLAVSRIHAHRFRPM